MVKSDTKVIKEQIEKECEAREPELIKYLAEVKRMEMHFRGFTVEHIPRKKNGEANDLAKAASRKEQLPPDVFFEIITAPSIKQDKQPMSLVNAISNEDWQSSIIGYLHNNYEPVEEHELKRMKQKSERTL